MSSAIAVCIGHVLQHAEQKALKMVGFTVKNTFIDDAQSLEASHMHIDGQQPAVLRAVTAPLPRKICLDSELDDEWAESTASSISGSDLDDDSDVAPEAMLLWPPTPSEVGDGQTTRAGLNSDANDVESPGSASSSVDEQQAFTPCSVIAPFPHQTRADDSGRQGRRM